MQTWRPWIHLGIILWVIVGLTVIPIPVTADDAFSDTCVEAETISGGSYSDQLSPKDRDVFVLDLEKGDSVSINMSFEAPSGDSEFTIFGLNKAAVVRAEETGDRRIELEEHFEPYGRTEFVYNHEPDISYQGSFLKDGSRARSIHDIRPETTGDNDGFVDDDNELVNHYSRFWHGPVGDTEFQIFTETDDPICIVLQTNSRSESGKWAFSMAINDNAPPLIRGSGNADELRTEIERKNQRITELERQVENLQAQLESRQGDSDVTITVEVSPSGGQRSFVKGGTAIIDAQSELADLSQLEVQYRGNTYAVDSTGQAAIPLSATGEQELTFSYQGVSESVMLDVIPADEADSTGVSGSTPGEDGDIIPVPGFGVPIAIAAFLAFALLASRRRR